ncbi:MAG: ECF-type sigma factor [Gemmatimonadota bacterium]
MASHGHSRLPIAELLARASQGNREAFDKLLPVVYEELQVLARSKLQAEREGLTLDTTGLVHEAYLKLVQQTDVTWQSRTHFFAIASQAMRRILIDYARRKAAKKRGERPVVVDLRALDRGEIALGGHEAEADALAVVALDDALTRLAEFNPRGAQIIERWFFGGLTQAEIADVMGLSEKTVRRSWRVARAWLRRELSAEEPT